MDESLTQEDLKKVVSAIVAFNKSKTWDEFLIKVDMLGLTLDEIEKKYSYALKMDEFIMPKILQRFARENGVIDLERAFNKKITIEFNGSEIRIALPTNVEYDFSSDLGKRVKLFYAEDKNKYCGCNADVYVDLAAWHQIGMGSYLVGSHLVDTLLYQLAVENSRS